MITLLVLLFGGLGASTRFVVDGSIRGRWARVFPLATVTINVTGSLLIGLLNGAHLFHGFGSPWFTAVTTGFCGGYTTFSTAMVETVRLVQAGERGVAVANALGTLVLCVAAASAGVGLMWLTGR
ncbi:fluoride efflux transporter FluC [Cellulomonas soli]|uniref:Fluoride-specific ion channel FluC n=1 Tax=Cellulomonas soli TaxID=931535 RepID=A0A512PGE2_9CELL|nr:CrcB family protein [Cellulomonas soli]NYI58141.1 CrcB protein [Cellulomonas soli]GEP70275.1 putative fluoride ion transporter CrcB [Cellulomonas soli]